MAETALLLDLVIQEENVDDPILQFFSLHLYKPFLKVSTETTSLWFSTYKAL